MNTNTKQILNKNIQKKIHNDNKTKQIREITKKRNTRANKITKQNKNGNDINKNI